MTRDLLWLVMMVKNEEASIGAAIASAAPHVDGVLVFDTGSTDLTVEKAEEAAEAADVALGVVRGEFTDFATSRNEALLHGERHADFLLMLSGDETLVGGEHLRAFCEEKRAEEGPLHGAYHVQVRFGTDDFASARLTRSGSGFRYQGAVHEVLLGPVGERPEICVPGAYVLHDTQARDPERHRARFQRDLQLLANEYVKEPGHARTVFYLAQTHECLGQHEKAYEFYTERVMLGGWKEETYEAIFRSARCWAALGKPWPEVARLYLGAHNFAPDRAEPLCAVAEHHAGLREWPLVYLYASRGLEIPYPSHWKIFVDRTVYDTRLLDLVATSAWYVDQHAKGKAAAEALLAKRPGDARIQKNLAFYENG